MESLFLKLVNMSISASWVVLAVVVLRFVFRSAPKGFRCVLWALVAVRLLCPVSIQSALSIMPKEKVILSSVISSGNVHVSSGVNGVEADPGVDQVPYGSYDNYDYDVPVQNAEPVMPAENAYIADVSVPENAKIGVNLMQILSVIWLCGAVALMLYGTVSFLKLKRKVNASIKLRDNIYLCDYVESPFILGVFRAKIYLPSDLYEEQYKYVIAHENAHLRRKDNLIKLIGFVLLAVYWFNPVIWLAYVLLCRDIELACDEKVIRDMGDEDKRAYSEALLSCSVPRKMILSCPLAFGEVGVKERIKSVLNYKKPAFWVLIVAVIACIIAAVCLLTNPVDSLETTENIQRDYSIQEVYFTYKDVEYDLTEQEQLINAVTAAYEVGNYIVVECHVNPYNNYYAIFDTAEERFVNGFVGTNLIWEEDNIYTATYSLWNEIYDYSGNLIGSVDLPEGGYIADLAFEDEASHGFLLAGQPCGIYATIFDGERYSVDHIFYWPNGEMDLLEGTNIYPLFPINWAGRYVMEYGEYGDYGRISGVYVKSIHEENGMGLLFYIARWDETLTEEEASQDGGWNFAKNKYLGKANLFNGGTYFLYYPDNVQYDVNDDEQRIEYETMAAQIDLVQIFGIKYEEATDSPTELTDDARNTFLLINDYINTASKSMPEAMRQYEYFEEDEDRERAANAKQGEYVITVRFMSYPEELNADLYVCEMAVYAPDMVNSSDSPYLSSRFQTTYIFAARVDDEFYIIRNIKDIPKSLRKGVDLSKYKDSYVL